MCILYNQRDATYTMFFIITSALHVSGGFFRPSSGAYKTMCSLRYCHAFLLSTTGVDGSEQFQPIHTSLGYCHALLLSTAGVDGLEQFQPIHTSLGYCHALLLSTTGVDGLEQFQPIQTSSRQQESMTIPKAAHIVL